MPPTEAGSGPGPATRLAGDPANAPDPCAVDTLELLLSDDIRRFFPGGAPFAEPPPPPPRDTGDTGDTSGQRARDPHVDPPGDPGRTHPAPDSAHSADSAGTAPAGDLLDGVAAWGALPTPVGAFRLVPVRIERDLALISHWMNDPAVAAFWNLAGPEAVTAAHLRTRVHGDGRCVPCLGVLDSVPMSYFEIYRADLDPLARHYPARPHDTGLHVLIGGVTHRGRGVGTALLRAVSELVLDRRPRCSRVVAEPDIRNTPSVSAFLSGGFRFCSECDLPGKRAALMIRDRALRHVL
ncbi:GNAT family N-acetyltransferase [Streptomyces yaizuensis]|uniref:Lysine N-acyltransferase MbtK n=1 Tax=Streptomyces yaizuensis TaxID=2989713 RepID=A0ABQ5PAU5_9ACTN|nr:GNAT family N-acetyltransferase [Streptomyces sp. YSPA8]GLF99677.1 acetyltransferase [Streptomyces sp. YSPA8]